MSQAHSVYYSWRSRYACGAASYWLYIRRYDANKRRSGPPTEHLYMQPAMLGYLPQSWDTRQKMEVNYILVYIPRMRLHGHAYAYDDDGRMGGRLLLCSGWEIRKFLHKTCCTWIAISARAVIHLDMHGSPQIKTTTNGFRLIPVPGYFLSCGQDYIGCVQPNMILICISQSQSLYPQSA